MQHVVPQLPSGIFLTSHAVFDNDTHILTVPAFLSNASAATDTLISEYNRFVQSDPTYGSYVEFYVTLSETGLNNFTSFRALRHASTLRP